MYFTCANKLKQQKEFPVRKIIDFQPCFFFNLHKRSTIVKEYQEKYNAIDLLLDEQPSILSYIHSDLKRLGTDHGRGSTISTEQILRSIIVMYIEQCPYREAVIRISESDFLRNFTRIGIGKVISFGYLCQVHKVISAETWEKINTVLQKFAIKEEKISGEKLRLDSTVSETNIHYPTDPHLLWDCYRVSARLVRQCTKAEPHWDCGNRFHDKKIKKLFVYVSTHFSKKNKSTQRKVKKCLTTLIERVDGQCMVVEHYIGHAKAAGPSSIFSAGPILLEDLEKHLPLARQVVTQSHRAHTGEKVPASDRIFSVFEEHTELLKRGKARKPLEFGHMVSIGQTSEKFISFYDVQSTSLHDTEIKDVALEAHKKHFKTYPDKFTADKNYHVSTDDSEKWSEEIAVYAVGKKGRRSQDEYEHESSENFIAMQRFRAGVEGTISVLKRAFRLRRCLYKGFKSFEAYVGCIVFCHNAVLLSRL